uniref:Uncharacterized protein n=1 Tax=viral metagenome TaxID=1070528 RepID=A0A6C0EM71_9ZZZZ
MFSEIVNYIVIPTLLSASALGAYYVWNPEDSKKLMSSIAWYGVNMYSRASIYYETFVKYDLSDNEEDDFDEEEELLYYNSESQLIVSLGTDYKTMPDEWWNDSKNNIDLLIFKKSLGDSIKYKIFNTHKELMKSDNVWDTLEKQFVQVELEQNGAVIDIHKHLDPFYTVGNRILSKSFLKWYLKSWYNTELCDKYTLKIFDKDVNLFSIGPESYILLGDEKYSIIDTTEEEETTNSDANYEGATNE